MFREQVVNLSKQYFGNETSEWNSAVVDTLGPVISLLNTSDIDKIDGVTFYLYLFPKTLMQCTSQ